MSLRVFRHDPVWCRAGMKRHLTAKLHRTRGIHAYPTVLAMVEKMTDAEAEGWFRILQNLEEDAKRDVRVQPWHRGYPMG